MKPTQLTIVKGKSSTTTHYKNGNTFSHHDKGLPIFSIGEGHKVMGEVEAKRAALNQVLYKGGRIKIN